MTPAAAGRGSTGNPQEPPGSLAVIPSSDDSPSAGAAIRSMADAAAQRGPEVTALPRVKAIPSALKDPLDKTGDSSIQDKLSNFMKAGSRLFVGGGCLNLPGVRKDKPMSGVGAGIPEAVTGMISGAKARITCQ